MHTIKSVIELAQRHIYVSYCGGYYVSRPYYGLSDYNGATIAPSNTCDYWMARARCRHTRIVECLIMLTSPEYADGINYRIHSNDIPDGDWRMVVRQLVREYRKG